MIEILVSLIILSVGILGFLSLDKDSLHWLTQTTELEQKNQIIFEINELIEEHDGLDAIANPCPACIIFSQLNGEWLIWQNTLPGYLKTTLSVDSNNALQLTLCEQEQCTTTVFQV